MPSTAPLRLVASRAEDPSDPPKLDPALSFRPAPPLAATAAEKPFLLAAAAALALHAAVLVWMAVGPADDAERSAGLGEDVIFLEGIPVELVESIPMPEAPPAEAAPETPAEETPPEPPEETAEPDPPPPEPVAESEPPPVEPPPPTDQTLPPAEAETGELPARPEEPPPVVEEVPPVEEPTPEVEPEPEERAPDPATVPTPRAKPERTEVAEAAPPKPAAPPPSAPSAPSSAPRSGGAGAGGAAQTAGKAAESAYRAKVAAQLARKKFYPSAARRDRLTGRTTVRFTLNASGRVTAANVVRSAGSRVLDQAALEMVRRAAPYPPIPKGLGATITIQAPIGFELPR
jgi:protein TonB